MPQVKTDGALASQPEHLIRMGCALMESGQGAKAVAIVKHVLAENPDDPLLREAAAIVLTHKVPEFHLNMLADEPRNLAYQRAIARSAAGKRVLDIGAGSGLLAMMAARAGASAVFACEANGALAATAQDIVAANGLAEVVRIIPRHSTKLDADADLGGAVDLTVAEIFSHDLIGEGVLTAMSDARRRLTGDKAGVIPIGASVRVALAEYRGRGWRPIGTVSGFDLSLFNRHVAASFNIAVGYRRLELRSAPCDLFEFDFSTAEFPAEAPARVRASADGGPVNGIVQWIRLQLDEDEVYENWPGPGARSHWPAVFHPFRERIDSVPGEEIGICGWRDQCRLRIWASGRG